MLTFGTKRYFCLVGLGLHIAPAALLALALVAVVDGNPALVIGVLTVRPKEGGVVGSLGGLKARGVADEREARTLGRYRGRHRTATEAEMFV